MNIRTAAIILALFAPVAALSVLAEQASNQPDEKPVEAKKQADDKPVSSQMSTPSPAPAAKNAGPWKPPANVVEARERAKRRLAQLEKMTDEEWQAEQRNRRLPPPPPAKPKKKQSKWDSFTPEQKINALVRRQEKLDGGRAPEIQREPAKPVSDLAPAANR